MRLLPTYKTVYLCSVSWPAMMISGQSVVQRAHRSGVFVLFAWFQIWLDWLLRARVSAAYERHETSPINRHARRMECRTMPPVRNYAALFYLFGRGIGRTQFLERLCVLSPLGRVRIYRMWYAGSVLQRRALLICYDHGWWRAPLGDFGRVFCGIWYVHLWLGWCDRMKKIQKNPGRFGPG